MEERGVAMETRGTQTPVVQEVPNPSAKRGFLFRESWGSVTLDALRIASLLESTGNEACACRAC